MVMCSGVKAEGNLETRWFYASQKKKLWTFVKMCLSAGGKLMNVAKQAVNRGLAIPTPDTSSSYDCASTYQQALPTCYMLLKPMALRASQVTNERLEKIQNFGSRRERMKR